MKGQPGGRLRAGLVEAFSSTSQRRSLLFLLRVLVMVMAEATIREEQVAEAGREEAMKEESEAWRGDSGSDIVSLLGGSEEVEGGCGMKEAEDEV
jgi:hypothetical protein